MQQKPVSSKLYDTDYYQTKNHGYLEFLNNFRMLPQFEAFIFQNAKKTDIVLDIGCGRGETIILCHKKKIKCYGIDYSQSAIKICRNSLNSLGIDKERALVMDAKKLKFKNESFDIVILLDVVEHLHDWELDKCLSEVRRVLKPNGKILVHTSPNKNNMDLIRKAASLFKYTLESEKYHINEQTPVSLLDNLSDFKLLSFKKIKDDNYFYNQTAAHSKYFRLLSKIVDFFYDSRPIKMLMKNDKLSSWLCTDMYYVGRKAVKLQTR